MESKKGKLEERNIMLHVKMLVDMRPHAVCEIAKKLRYAYLILASKHFSLKNILCIFCRDLAWGGTLRLLLLYIGDRRLCGGFSLPFFHHRMECCMLGIWLSATINHPMDYSEEIMG